MTPPFFGKAIEILISHVHQLSVSVKRSFTLYYFIHLSIYLVNDDLLENMSPSSINDQIAKIGQVARLHIRKIDDLVFGVAETQRIP